MLHRNHSAVISFDDASYPLKPQLYYEMAYNNSNTGSHDAEFIKSHATAHERKLLNSYSKVPDMNDPRRITRVGNCYSYVELDKEDEELFLVYEKIEGQIYLASLLKKCVNRGEKTNSVARFVTIVDNEVRNMKFLGIDGGSHNSKIAEKFTEWALGLNKYSKWSHGVSIIKDEEGADYPSVKGTSAYKAFYHEHKASFDIGNIEITGHSNVGGYKTELDLKTRLQKQYEIYKQKKRKEKEKQKQLEAAKRNDGVIRYAFGRELGATVANDLSSVATFTLDNIVERSPFFENYIEKTTPSSNKVMSISAVSKPLNAGQCSNMGEKVMSFLEAKYGQADEYTPIEPLLFFDKERKKKIRKNYFLYFKRITQAKHNRLVEVVCVTDSYLNAKIRQQYKSQQCNLNDNYIDQEYLDKYQYGMQVSKYTLYNRYTGDKGPSDFGRHIVPYSFYKSNQWSTLYPVPIPSNSSTFNSNYKRCNLKESQAFLLMIRYADVALEKEVRKEQEAISRTQKINSDEARGL